MKNNYYVMNEKDIRETMTNISNAKEIRSCIRLSKIFELSYSLLLLYLLILLIFGVFGRNPWYILGPIILCLIIILIYQIKKSKCNTGDLVINKLNK